MPCMKFEAPTFNLNNLTLRICVSVYLRDLKVDAGTASSVTGTGDGIGAYAVSYRIGSQIFRFSESSYVLGEIAIRIVGRRW